MADLGDTEFYWRSLDQWPLECHKRVPHQQMYGCIGYNFNAQKKTIIINNFNNKFLL